MATWIDHARTDYAAGDSCPTARATFLRERNDLLYELPIQVEFIEATTQVVTPYTSVVTFDIFVPGYAAGANLKAVIEAHVDAGSGDFRLFNSTHSVDGTEVTGITAVAYEDAPEASLAIADGQANQLVTFGVKAKIDNGANTMFVRNLDRLTFWFEV